MKFQNFKTPISFLFILFLNGWIFSQDANPFQFYNQNGNKISFEKMVRHLVKYDVILFGENHDNSINHWLELRVAKALYLKRGKDLILGAEMFERDNQQQVNKFLNGGIISKDLKDSMRLWSNHYTDYHPLLEFAKENKLEFIATNIPRKYASQVYKQGLESLESLSPIEKSMMMKLPIEVSMETPGYSEMLEMMVDHDQNVGFNFVAAQAVKDATMAESIYQKLTSNKLFLHFNGNYHSKEYGGIYWYLKKTNPELKIAVISLFETDGVKNDWKKEAKLTEFNLVIPSDMTKTY